ncbi:type VI secretion system baseplate subunit TssE [Amaricoccus solimangrovi]|uniref:Type VI secretion system baseplate subunit TssE n=1 Tax=Amaricoccus solimangrovi TaxID=2589815 RepID=A0A501WP79_9RHOB|nr:type VI secretion system baseplate subunit TssE [Amaricoccus solimangrovi]TPE49097.1 type VI secretion system baseplate subunit TssE [Amaricoccus solimangrovi]
MIETGDSPRSTREAAQPSLWDRLINDLPGIASEIEGLRGMLDVTLGAERVEALVAGGPRAIEAEADLAPAVREQLARLCAGLARRAEIETRGIVVSGRVLREAVRRDIEALFNTERFESTPLRTPAEAVARPDDPPSLADFPEVRRSVVNYGVPAFAGRAAKDFDQETLAREIKAVLATFEPRLRESATRVTVSTGDKTGITIEIDGLLVMSPVPERLILRTLVDLETGWARTSLREA